MRLLEYQIDDVRRAVERYNETYGGATGEHERQAIIDLVERIEEIIHPMRFGDARAIALSLGAPFYGKW